MPFSSSPPRTQYDRNLTIRLTGGGNDVIFTFPIKPGEFQSDHPARVTTTQTLQGVYQDFGGLGIRSLTYQGSTGWRRRALSDYMDGFECFKKLYQDIFTEYHSRISASSDPNDIQCLVIDDLYDEVYVVSIDDFQATKSKSSPLLYSYVMKMTVQSSSENDRDPTDISDLILPSVGLDPSSVPIKLNEMFNGVYIWDISRFRQYTLQLGDSLESVSFMFFGTTSRWRDIANANAVISPYIVETGTTLIIPW